MADGDRFGQIVSSFFGRQWERFPTSGSAVGLREYDDRLETPDARLLADHLNDLCRTREEVESLPEPRAGTAEDLDRQAFDAHLLLDELQYGKIQSWRRDCSLPVTDVVAAVFELLMRRDVSKPETVSAIVHRLERFGKFLRAGRERIDDPVAIWVETAGEAVEGGIAFLKEAIPPLGRAHPDMQGELDRAANYAFEALADYGEWLAELKNETLNEDPAAGAEVLQTIVREDHGLHLTLDEVEETGWSLVQHYRDQLDTTAREIDADADWHGILGRERAGYAETACDILAAYREQTASVRERLVSQGILDLPPAEECRVVSTPSFLRAFIPTAAYSSPGALDENQTGFFFVSDPLKSLSDQEYRAAVGQHWGIEATAAHEAYPGHHVQLCWANRVSSLARKLAGHIVFMEGWTLYCEQLMIELGWLDAPAMKLNYLVDQLWRAYRVVIDVGVHTRKMSVASAVKTLMDGVGFTEARARTELNWYTQSPGVPMSYQLGKRATLQLRAEYMKLGGATLKGFHNWLLGFGSIPQRWLIPFIPS